MHEKGGVNSSTREDKSIILEKVETSAIEEDQRYRGIEDSGIRIYTNDASSYRCQCPGCLETSQVIVKQQHAQQSTREQSNVV